MGALREMERLGRLPHAVSEARAVRGALGGDSVVLTGEQATESALKGVEIGRFRVVHLAAHALVDERNPDRSAVLLGAGAPTEDGLLQYREIVDLDLAGPVVVLSACRSGSGPVVGGDGVLGLAQAFFLGGSRTVVASLWPLRDDEAATLVERFAAGLGQGRTVAAALAEAQRAMIDRGAPAAAWAGMVVLGDGDRVLFDGTGFGWGWSAGIAIVAAALAGIALLALVRARGGDPRPD
jgi:CHAT domain-containing protein